MIAFERLLSKVQAVQKTQCYCLRYYPPKETLPRELKINLFTNSAYHENGALWKPWQIKNNNNKTKAGQIDENLSSQVKCTTVLRQHRFTSLKNAVHCSTCSFHWGVLALQRSPPTPFSWATKSAVISPTMSTTVSRIANPFTPPFYTQRVFRQEQQNAGEKIC